MSDQNSDMDLVEGEDFYFNEVGELVFTEKYHLNRGECCGSGCLHCPWGKSFLQKSRES